jgi:hypothetical protein
MYLLIALALACAFLYVFGRRQSLPYPPGPPSDPVIGHLKRIPAGDFPKQLVQWAREHGAKYFDSVTWTLLIFG